jgi:hypothetical protein
MGIDGETNRAWSADMRGVGSRSGCKEAAVPGLPMMRVLHDQDLEESWR